jgi:hypothetical protein
MESVETGRPPLFGRDFHFRGCRDGETSTPGEGISFCFGGRAARGTLLFLEKPLVVFEGENLRIALCLICQTPGSWGAGV